MKFIVVGLGNFGASLAEKLTEQGNEVIGIDREMSKVTALKDTISHTICLDATDKATVADLPLQNTDVVVVCIGGNSGTNVIVSALFKNLGVKRLISRSADSLHEHILNAIGVSEIAKPEVESAERWAKKLCLKGLVNSFDLNPHHSVIEIKSPSTFIGQTVQQIGFRENYNILILTIIKPAAKKSYFGLNSEEYITGIPKPDTVIDTNDILVLYGNTSDLQKIITKNEE
ncbi:MAG: TrkA family potassium uptake protein [Saprospiraceae bacterium]|nr:TrkA family potassium uptake protein [Saprospiraceae bacterium]